MNSKKDNNVYVLHNKRLNVKDVVIKITGRDKNNTGEILAIDRKKSTVIVKGMNLRKKWQKPSQENPKGGIMEIEQPVHLSNVMLYDSKTKKGMKSRMEMSQDKKTAKKIRVSKESGKEI